MDTNAPIGIFDSGLGGLTVARELARALPHESFIYVGDTARCPYGPRDLEEVRRYVRQICTFLQDRGVKLIIIACNTATAAGLSLAQREFNVPVIGVIEPGARAAVRATRNRRVGIIGTVGTIESDVYSKAIRTLDAGTTVYSVATPPFVDMVEDGLALNGDYHDVYVPPRFYEIARDYLDALRKNEVDTLVLGCTHYPLLQNPIHQVMGTDVVLVSSAEETARDVLSTLTRRGNVAWEGSIPHYEFFTTGDPDRFEALGSKVFGATLEHLELLELATLESLVEE